MTKLTWVGGGVIVAAIWAWSAMAPQAYTADQPSGFASRELVTHFQDQAAGPTILTVVEPQTHVLAVYHINRETGEVALKSVRNFEQDLRLVEFNSAGLSPDEIRRTFERQH
jgi:hypothetical protein